MFIQRQILKSIIFYSFVFAVAIFTFSGCKCSQLAAPNIIVTPAHPMVGQKLMLTAQDQPKTKIVWSGPFGTYTGNPMIIDSVSSSNSGNYSAQYISTTRRHCVSDIATEHIVIDECPPYPEPRVVVNSDLVKAGTQILLAIPSMPNTTVSWKGPDNSYLGNPWIRESATKAMSGIYTAKYIHDVIPGCESKVVSKSVSVTDRSIEVKYNDVTYFLDIVSNGNSATVWLRSDKMINTPGKDLLVGQFELHSVSGKEARETMCRYADNMQKSKFLLGCLKAAGAAGCTLGVIASEGAAIPICVGFLANPAPAFAKCILGVAGEIAKALGKEGAWETAQASAAISKADLEGALEGLISMYCLDAMGEKPIINSDGRVVAAPHPTPAPPSRPSPGTGSRPDRPSEGHEHPDRPRPDRPSPPDRPSRPGPPDRPSRPGPPDRPSRPGRIPFAGESSCVQVTTEKRTNCGDAEYGYSYSFNNTCGQKVEYKFYVQLKDGTWKAGGVGVLKAGRNSRRKTILCDGSKNVRIYTRKYKSHYNWPAEKDIK